MRALWILLLLLFVLVKSEAQLNGIDSTLLARYSKSEIASASKSFGGTNSGQLFFLVKWKTIDPAKNKNGFQILRSLSNEHSIVLINNFDQFKQIQEQFYFIAPANDEWKLPGTLINESKSGEHQWLVTTLDPDKFANDLATPGLIVIDENRSTNTFLVQVNDSSALQSLLHSQNTIFLQPFSRKAREELLINGFDLGTNKINLAHDRFPALNGAGMVVSVKENQFDTTDIDFKGRYLRTGLASPIVTGHATIMATMIGGAGNTYHLGKGVAWNSTLGSSNFAQLLPSADAVYNQLHITVENHSYGTAIENFYGADAAAYDASVANNPFLVHVFSSGNSGTSTSSSGAYAGIPNYANLTGSFKMAKNILTVGATDSFNNVEVMSSRGPAYDGRIKPDLVAVGQDGSSGAAALVSGTALLIQQAFKTQHQDSLPPASLVKASIINGADDVGNPGPDYISGYGSLDAYAALQSIFDKRYFLSSVTDKSTQHLSINISPAIKQIRITMAYTDLPAQPNAMQALMNDLDIELVEQATGKTWKPWVLNGLPNKDSLALNAIRKRDSVNTVEVISIDSPPPGSYDLKILGHKVSNASQSFAIVYALDSVDQFYWSFPTRPDPVFAGNSTVARWGSTIDGTGTIEFSGDEGQTWQTVASNVQLQNKFSHWQVPDAFTTGLLRMQANGKTFTSDTFVISKNIQLHVGFDCADSVLLVWNKVDKADQYHLYSLGAKFMESQAFLKDTLFVFAKKDITAKHFAVAPMQGAIEGIRSFTINYETQGVGCYIKNFLAQLLNNHGSISLELGTVHQLKQIEIQQDNGSAFNTIQTIANPTQLNFQFDNLLLHQGINKFRIKLTLMNGTTVFSNTETIYFTGTNDYVVYPNPVLASNGFTLLRKDPQEETLVIFDLYGRRIMRAPLFDIINPIMTASLQKGVYLIIVFDKNGNRKYTQKLVVQ